MVKKNPKQILITGCSSGIGLETAIILRKKGYQVFPTARKKADVQMLKNKGFDAVLLDTESSDSIKKAVSYVLKKTNNKLYALFNNAGFAIPGAIEDLSRQDIRKQFEANLFGHIELTNILLPYMRNQRQGKIIWNSSVLGFVSMPYRGAYSATKYAMEALSDAMRLELKGTGIHVSTIEPGPIETKFNENAYKMFMKYINPKKTMHTDIYTHLKKRLSSKKPITPGTLQSEAVVKKVVHILKSKNPKPNYYVTWPTYLMGILRRVLPKRILDWVLYQEVRRVKS